MKKVSVVGSGISQLSAVRSFKAARPKQAASIKSMFTALGLLVKEVKPIAEEAEAAGLKSAKAFNSALDKAIDAAQKCYDEAKKALVQRD